MHLNSNSANCTLLRVEVCPCCASTLRKIIYKNVPDFKYKALGNWSFIRCLNCGLVYIDPRLVDNQKAYPENYSQYKVPSVPNIHVKGLLGLVKEWVRRGVLYSYGYNGITKSLLVALLGRYCSIIPYLRLQALYGFVLFPKMKEGASKLLDIGCGNGHFLAIMQSLGWEVYGIEPDQRSVNIAKELIDVHIFPSLQEAHFLDNFFDVITMNHVFEHVGEPIPAMEECYRILKRCGKIGICVPNWKSFSHHIFGEYCYHLEPPRHLVMYEPASLKMVLCKVGLTADSVETISLRESKVAFKKSWLFKMGTPPKLIVVVVWSILTMLISFVKKDSGEEILLWGSKRY